MHPPIHAYICGKYLPHPHHSSSTPSDPTFPSPLTVCAWRCVRFAAELTCVCVCVWWVSVSLSLSAYPTADYGFVHTLSMSIILVYVHDDDAIGWTEPYGEYISCPSAMASAFLTHQLW